MSRNLSTAMKETIVFTIGVVAIISVGVFLFRKREVEVSDEQLQRTLDRATEALASANAEIERCRNNKSLDYNPLLKDFALKGSIEMRDIMQNVYDGALKAVQERRAKQK
jgi:hypothetical protein